MILKQENYVSNVCIAQERNIKLNVEKKTYFDKIGVRQGKNQVNNK